MAFNGEPVIVSRKENKNVVIISEAEYNKLEKAKKNAEYLATLNLNSHEKVVLHALKTSKSLN